MVSLSVNQQKQQQEETEKPQNSPTGESAVSSRAKEILAKVTTGVGENSGPSEFGKLWDKVFREREYSSEVLAEAFAMLHARKQYDVAVEGLLSSIRNDHAQPWTYDVLAIEMALAKRPATELDRVLQSRIDFVPGDLTQVMLTVAMLSRFDAHEQALDLCQKAAESNPEMPEPWLVGRNVADRLGRPEDQVWARCGILQHVWLADYARLHEEARKTIQRLIEEAEKRGDAAAASAFRERLLSANARDVKVTLKWAGTADLDLMITEPSGVRCDFRTNITPQGGRLVKVDSGSAANKSGNHEEQYVCHTAANGEYQSTVRFVLGNVVAGTAVLEIIQNENSPQETRTRKVITLRKEDAVVSFTVDNGRLK
ncbi:MAG: hypothetical protein JNL58_25575 [Planctomyces sp.]|nr:hypothetical protein [Planctomyces sp.]